MRKVYNSKDLFLEILLLPFTDIEILNKILDPENYFFYNTSDTDHLKRQAQLDKEIVIKIQKKESIYSIDEVFLFIKKLYRQEHRRLKQPSPNQILLEHLRIISAEFLSHREGRVCLKYWKTELGNRGHSLLGPYEGLPKLTLWNSLTRKMSIDLLACNYLNFTQIDGTESKDLFIDDGGTEYKKAKRSSLEVLEGFYNDIALEDMQLESVLQQGISETHLHASAGKNFYQTWEMLMNCSDRPEIRNNIKALEKDRHLFADRSWDLKKMILVANVYRYLLLLSLELDLGSDLKVRGLDHELRAISNNRVGKDTLANLVDEEKSIPIEELSDLVEALESFLEIHKKLDIKPFYRELKTKYVDALAMVYADKGQVNVQTIHSSGCFEYAKSIPENMMLFQVICKLNFSEKPCMSKIFFKYIAIKNTIYQELVQQNQVKGLSNFIDYFKISTQMGKQKKLVGEIIKWEQTLRYQFQDKNLKKIEFRIAMDEKDGSIQKIQEGLLKTLATIIQVYLKIHEEDRLRKLPLMGIIIHFIKVKDEQPNKCWMSYGKEGLKDEFIDHQKSRRLYAKQIIALKDLLYKVEGLSKLIVGIDAANDENAAEPWVFAPIYDYARDGRDVLQTKNKSMLNHLGFTFHAGEDFRHLLTGLRRIDEVVNHFKYHASDRVGHGIVLGINVQNWKRKHPVVILPRIEYLENLLWVWGVYKNQALVDGIDGFLERRIMELANEIYPVMEGITVYELWKSYQAKFKEFVIPKFLSQKSVEQCTNILEGRIQGNYMTRLFCCEIDERHAYVWNSEKLSLTYHCKVYREKMLEPISVSTEEFSVQILEELQQLVRKKLSQEGIIVETNPTSNRAIGEIDDIFEHYIIDLKSKKFIDSTSDESVGKNLMVTINTDDPCVFQTTLSSEFAYIYYALLDRGYAKRDVLEWINEVRINGMSSSFVKDRDFKDYIQELKSLECEIKKFL